MLEATLAGLQPIQMPVDSSRLEGFYKLSVSERREKLAEIAGLTPEQVEAWSSSGESVSYTHLTLPTNREV